METPRSRSRTSLVGNNSSVWIEAAVTHSSTYINRNRSASISRGQGALVGLETSEVGGISRGPFRHQNHRWEKYTCVIGGHALEHKSEIFGAPNAFAETCSMCGAHGHTARQCHTALPTHMHANIVVAASHGPPAPQEHYSSVRPQVAWPQPQGGLVLPRGAQQRDGGGVGGDAQQRDGGGVRRGVQ